MVTSAISPSTNMATIGRQGVLRVVPEAQLQESERAVAEAKVAAAQALQNSQMADMTQLAGYVQGQYNIFRRHRDGGSGWSKRLLDAQRAFNGEYPPEKLSEIRKFGGSEVYARVIAMKCRGASSLLRDVYLSPERSWGIDPPADPDIPPHIIAAITQLVQAEVGNLTQASQMSSQVSPISPQAPPDAGAIRDRMMQLMEAARIAEKRAAKKRAEIATERIEEILNEGGFYKALAEFIVDLPLFPFACIKGPVVRIVPTVVWGTNQQNGPQNGTQNGESAATTQQKPKLFWQRTSPFDVYWTPGVSDIEDAAVIERIRLTRGDLNDLLDLPGYNVEAIRAVLDEYGRGGLADNWDSSDTERAQAENRENPQWNQSGLINCLEFHGNVQGRALREYGFNDTEVPDELRDYFVQVWLIGRHVIKAQLSPSPRKRHPYFITSFEKVPGTPVGNGLPDILSDIADVANATLRSLVNNLSISSGPQVVIDDDRASPNQNSDDLYPWKRWHVSSDPLGGTQGREPVYFFQPNSNAGELLTIYKELNNIADDLSAIPKYMAGSSAAGGAGRTAAGLAMLMGNASKILQTVAANIDRDVFEGLLNALFDMIMLTDASGILRGDESIKVMGVNVAIQRETQRSRQLEFLQITANPLDQQIIGPRGRASVLRSVAGTIGLDGESIVPSEEKLAALEQQAAQAPVGPDGKPLPPEVSGGQAGPAAQAQGSQTPQGGNVTGDMGPRVNIAGGVG